MTRNEYVLHKKRQLELWSADLDALQTKSDKGEIVIEKELHEQFSAMRLKYFEVAGKLDSIKTATGNSLKEMKKETDKVWTSLKLSAAELVTQLK